QRARQPKGHQMNPRVITALSGIFILGLGAVGLLYPDKAMGLLGYAVAPGALPAAVLGEVRATYGGLFVAMGVFTLLSAFDPAAHRGRLTLISCLWLGAALGRLLAVSINGSPGLFGWLSLVSEILVGVLLLSAAWLPAREPAALSVPAYEP